MTISQTMTFRRHMRRPILIFFLFIQLSHFSCVYSAQSLALPPAQYTWIGGSPLPNQPGVFGTMGIPKPANKPGARHFAAMVLNETSGQLFVFGGNRNIPVGSGLGFSNELWRYDLRSKMWTWLNGSQFVNSRGVFGVKNVAAVTNVPPGRQSHSLVMVQNTLFLFGGRTNDGVYNDLWRVDLQTLSWIWLSGSDKPDDPGHWGPLFNLSAENCPSARQFHGMVSHTQSQLLLFGGLSFAGDYLNDLWTYDIAFNGWSWIGGSQLGNDPGFYGVKGVEAAGNRPPGRYAHTMTYNPVTQKVVVFGGIPNLPTYYAEALNDLWYWNPATEYWAWISGENVPRQIGVYGTLGVPDENNVPGSRAFHTMAVDVQSGNLIVLGGVDSPVSAHTFYSDVWLHDHVTNLWTWAGGNSTAYQASSYGSFGVASTQNMFGSRYGHTMVYQGDSNDISVFGGCVWDATGFKVFSDLWIISMKLNCSAGSYQQGWSCAPCPDGSYQPAAGQSACLPCPYNALTCTKFKFTCLEHFVWDSGTNVCIERQCTGSDCPKPPTNRAPLNFWAANPIAAILITAVGILSVFMLSFVAGYTLDDCWTRHPMMTTQLSTATTSSTFSSNIDTSSTVSTTMFGNNSSQYQFAQSTTITANEAHASVQGPNDTSTVKDPVEVFHFSSVQ